MHHDGKIMVCGWASILKVKIQFSKIFPVSVTVTVCWYKHDIILMIDADFTAFVACDSSLETPETL